MALIRDKRSFILPVMILHGGSEAISQPLFFTPR